ncbi:MAG: glycoside hydrolase family 16 protein [Bacteroidota bacterium]|jgi:beta-glucanase (GH16 family)
MRKRNLFWIGIIGLAILPSCLTNKNSVNEKKANYELVWADEFDGNSINLDNWTFEIWDAGRVNNEWQKYVENTDNYQVENGILSITAIKTGENKKGGYTSTRLSSQKKKEFQYGRIEFRAKMPKGKGTWPALWMLGSNIKEVGWPRCGEIDVLEYVGYQPNIVHTNIHTKNDYGVTDNKVSINLKTTEEEFHIYGILWTAESISFYIDSPHNIKNTYAPLEKNADNWAYSQPFYLIMNFAVGGDWGGVQGVDETIWPQTLEVDYVRVYQLK